MAPCIFKVLFKAWSHWVQRYVLTWAVLALRAKTLCCMKVSWILKNVQQHPWTSINQFQEPSYSRHDNPKYAKCYKMSPECMCVCVGGRVMYLHVHWEPLRFEIKTLNKSPQRRYETWYPTQKGKENLWLLWKVVNCDSRRWHLVAGSELLRRR